jgi:hypothetical protein
MEMAWTDARAFLTAAARLERERLLHASIAARLSQAEEKAWKDWLKSMDR